MHQFIGTSMFQGWLDSHLGSPTFKAGRRWCDARATLSGQFSRCMPRSLSPCCLSALPVPFYSTLPSFVDVADWPPLAPARSVEGLEQLMPFCCSRIAAPHARLSLFLKPIAPLAHHSQGKNGFRQCQANVNATKAAGNARQHVVGR